METGDSKCAKTTAFRLFFSKNHQSLSFEFLMYKYKLYSTKSNRHPSSFERLGTHKIFLPSWLRVLKMANAFEKVNYPIHRALTAADVLQ